MSKKDEIIECELHDVEIPDYNISINDTNVVIKFELPTQQKTYTPDFPINNSFIVEAKGAFNSQDRKKHKLIKAQRPELDIRFIFSNSKTKIGKKSLTTYGKWCELNNFKYHCVQSTKIPFPKEWLEEIKNERRN